MDDTEREVVARALGRIPSGLFIVTLRKGEKTNAFLASWVQQAAFDPPLVSVAVREGRPTQQLLAEGAVFAVNILPTHAIALLKHFARGFAPGDDPYQGIKLRLGTSGVELLEDALAMLECRVAGSIVAGDHVIYLGEVLGASMGNATGDPVVHVRKNGFNY